METSLATPQEAGPAVFATRDQSNAPGFGQLLRRHRTEAGLSQEALAERAGLSTRAVSDLERGVKTRPHPSTMRMLADALGLDQPARAALAGASRPGSAAPAAPVMHAPAATIPIPATPLVGRERELAAALGYLRPRATRLLTLTGPGGVGKTRLTLDIAHAMAADPAGAVAFVELAPIADPALVLPAIAAALGLRDAGERPLADAMRDHLVTQPLLLVLDNCEHLLAAVQPLAADLLATAPGLAILASSRGPLHLRGEQVLPVPPLALPDPARLPPLAELAAIPAIDLFLQRATAVRPGFRLDDGNARDIAAICARLDGLPLAIELAAAWLRLVSPAELAPMLERRLQLLTAGPADVPARHQTIRATIDWSHDLLPEAHRVLFRRLAVLAGGGTLAAIAAIATEGDPFAAIEGLDALADQGLLRAEEATETRFGMLETVRAYALERLAGSGEAEATHAALLAWLMTLAEQAGPLLESASSREWLDRLADEQDNVRAALAWSIGGEAHGDPAAAMRLAAALWPYWHMRGHLHEGHTWLERAVAAGANVAPADRANALMKLANIAINLEDHDRARQLYTESLHLYEDAGNRLGVAAARVGLGLAATSQGRHDEARSLLEQAHAVYEESGDGPHLIPGLYALGRLAAAEGRFAEAGDRFAAAKARCHPEDPGTPAYLDLELAQLARASGDRATAFRLAASCLDRFRELGERRAEATSLAELGQLALAGDDREQARALLLEAAEIHLDLRDEYGIVRALEGLALVADGDGQDDLSALLIQATEAWRSRTGTALTSAERAALAPLRAGERPPGQAPGLDQALAAARAAPRTASRAGISSTAHL